MAMAAKFKKKEEERRRAEEAAAFLGEKDIQAAKERAAREKEAREEKERLAALEADEEEAAKERERIWKTKEYFEINKYGRKRQPDDYPMYFGHHVGTHGAWRPEGPGEMYVEGEKVFDGHYVAGLEHGYGENYKWKGEFKAGRIDGVGKIDGRECLVRHNMIVVFKDELLDGHVLEFMDASMRQPNETQRPRATILYHVKKWRYQLRYWDESRPLERSLDLSTLYNRGGPPFRIVNKRQHIYPLNHFKQDVDSVSGYKFWKDVYGQDKRPVLGAVGGRREGDTRAHGIKTLTSQQRTTTKYDENVFEPREVGIGAAMEAENVELQAELKKQQWAKLIDERRAEEEKKKKAEIAAEEEKQMQEQLEAQRKKAQKQKEDDDVQAKKDSAEMEAFNQQAKEAAEIEDARIASLNSSGSRAKTNTDPSQMTFDAQDSLSSITKSKTNP